MAPHGCSVVRSGCPSLFSARAHVYRGGDGAHPQGQALGPNKPLHPCSYNTGHVSALVKSGQAVQRWGFPFWGQASAGHLEDTGGTERARAKPSTVSPMSARPEVAKTI